MTFLSIAAFSIDIPTSRSSLQHYLFTSTGRGVLPCRCNQKGFEVQPKFQGRSQCSYRRGQFSKYPHFFVCTLVVWGTPPRFENIVPTFKNCFKVPGCLTLLQHQVPSRSVGVSAKCPRSFQFAPWKNGKVLSDICRKKVLKEAKFTAAYALSVRKVLYHAKGIRADKMFRSSRKSVTGCQGLRTTVNVNLRWKGGGGRGHYAPWQKSKTT